MRGDSADRVNARLQGVAIVIAFLFAAVPHLSNDGLWFQGDSGRHAINGFFWWDVISTLPRDPKDFALRYYARYPAVIPVSYPPMFYLLEGTAFRLLGPSPFVAKGLVLIFALSASLYVSAWLRRWVSPLAGWGGALLLLQPGIVLWSNAVMLNVPSMALGVAALYHGRWWLDAPGSRQLYFAAALVFLTAATYFPAALVGGILCVWIVTEGRVSALFREHRFLVLGFFLLGVFAIAFLIRWAPLHLSMALPNAYRLVRLESTTYYARSLTSVVDPTVLALALFAIVVGLADRAWRRETKLLLIWTAVIYVGLSFLGARDARYGILLVPPVLILAVLGLWMAVRGTLSILGGDARRCFVPIVVGLIVMQAYVVQAVRVPRVEGFREVASFLAENAPGERIFYEGDHDGVFTFYVRAADPGFRRAVIRGSKLLYANAIFSRWRLIERATSAERVIEILKKDCGCRWLAIEIRDQPDDIAAVAYLREALQRPQFELMKSFPIDSIHTHRIDVYRVLMPIEVPKTIPLPFPVISEETVYRAAPIER